jgi:anti-sigma factor RsiW
MTCVEAEPLLGACLDAELDARTALEIEQHLSGCDACSGLYRNLELLHEEIVAAELDWSAGADLRSLRAAIRRRNSQSWWRTSWLNPSILGTAAAVLLLAIFLPGRLPLKSNNVERQVVDNHVRSLMADHLVDVPSSDRHTVKPWFQGKLGFSPLVPDLAAEGFVLIGGRLDVIAARPAAAIVYKRQNHVVNLWVTSDAGSEQKPELTDIEGFHLLRWRHSGMLYWAVSDLNVTELRQFAELIRSR